MGASLSWVAVEGLSLADALDELNFEVDEAAPKHHSPKGFGAAELPNGWLLFIMPMPRNGFDERFTALSRRGATVACAIEEHVMYSEARGYSHGGEIWRIIHDCNADAGLFHLDATGDLPLAFEEIRRQAIEQQTAEGGEDADCDYVFDVPGDLTKSVCGFKFGETEPFDPVFAEIRKRGASRSAPKRGGLLQRLFGRG